MDGHVGHTSFRTNIQEITLSAASYLMMTEEWLAGIPVFKLQGRANCLSIVMATSWRIYLFPSFFPLPSLLALSPLFTTPPSGLLSCNNQAKAS